MSKPLELEVFPWVGGKLLGGPWSLWNYHVLWAYEFVCILLEKVSLTLTRFSLRWSNGHKKHSLWEHSTRGVLEGRLEGGRGSKHKCAQSQPDNTEQRQPGWGADWGKLSRLCAKHLRSPLLLSPSWESAGVQTQCRMTSHSSKRSHKFISFFFFFCKENFYSFWKKWNISRHF